MSTGRLGAGDTAIEPTLLDAKGDLVTAVAADTPARLAVGNNGETLVADSSTSTGLRWQPAKSVNYCLNSAFDIWQRGTSFTATASSYGPDRWQVVRDGGVAGSTFSRQLTNDTTNLPFIQYAVRGARNSGNTSTNTIFLVQSFESAQSIPLAGRTVTLSFYARAGANYSSASSALQFRLSTGTGTDQNLFQGYTGGTNPINSIATLTTTWQRFQASATLPSNITEAGVMFNYTPVGTAGANDWFEITGVQVEIGSIATAFQTATGTLAGELAAAMRYFERMEAGGVDSTFGCGVAYLSNTPLIPIQFQVRKRVVPSMTFAGTWELIGGNTIITMTSPNVGTNSTSVFGFQMGGTATGLTQGHAQLLRAGTDNPYIDISAEL